MIFKKQISILIVSTLVACSSVENITISVLKPASYSFPAEINRISIAFLKTEKQDRKGEISSINNIRLDPGINYYTHYYDYINGLTDAFVNSPRFEDIVLSEIDSSDLYTDTKKINWPFLVEFCRNDSTEALLLLSEMYLSDSLGFTEILDNGCNVMFAITNNVRWELLYPEKLEIINGNLMKNTLFWEETGIDCSEALDKLPEGRPMIEESCYVTANKLGIQLAPQWKDIEHRNYYSYGNEMIKTGSFYAGTGDWEKAEENWLTATESASRSVASKATYNMALASEMKDDLEQAMLWIQLSDSLKSTPISRIYKMKLNERLKERDVLNNQMGISE